MDKKEITYSPGCIPKILYTTRQYDDAKTIRRPLHRHNDACELLYVVNGTGEYVVDGYRYLIGPGDILLYNSSTLHEVSSLQKEDIETLCIGIGNLSLRGLKPGQMASGETGFVRPSKSCPELVSMIYSIFSLMENKNSYSRELSESMLRSVILMAVNLPSDSRIKPLAEETSLTRNITKYIDMNFAKDIRLSNIAAACNVSVSYAAHVYKKETGQSPIQYTIRRRIGEAQNLLIASDLSSTEIAHRVGYDNVIHFNSIFKKKVGMPPIRYRKHFLKNMKGYRTQ